MVAAGLPAGCPDRHRAFTNHRRNGTNRFASRDDDDRQNQQAQRQAGRENALTETELVHKDTERQQAIHNRRHRSQIGDIDFNDLGHPVAFGVLLKINPGRDAERHGSQRRNQHDEQRADPGRENAGLVGMA